MDFTVFLLGGLALGCLHAMDADHITSVSMLILEKLPFRKTLPLALRWSTGHAVMLFVLAGLMTGMKTTFEALDLSGAEQWVGASMIGLGLWVFVWQWKKERTGEFGKAHKSRSEWALFGMGVLHGMAGSSSILLLIPVALSQSVLLLFGYVLSFSLGMMLAMGCYAFLVSHAIRFKTISVHLVRLRYLAAGITIVIGLHLFTAGATT